MGTVTNSDIVNNFERELKALSELTTKTDILVKETLEMRVRSMQLACSLSSLRMPELDKAAKDLAEKVLQAERHSGEIQAAESRTVQLRRKLATAHHN